MCQDCGCSLPQDEKLQNVHANPQLNDPKTITVIAKILEANDHEAAHIREHFDAKGILALNLMSSPGAGKTTLLESLAGVRGADFVVIEGDLETSKDADRLIAKGVRAKQITTGTACHLDAHMVHDALHHFPLDDVKLLFIENVGNLVCPASYDVGAHLNVVLLSISEGDDKIEKYPVMFKKADLVIFTKTDLLEHFDFDLARAKSALRKLNPKADVLEFSSKKEGAKAFNDYLNMKMGLR